MPRKLTDKEVDALVERVVDRTRVETIAWARHLLSELLDAKVVKPLQAVMARNEQRDKWVEQRMQAEKDRGALWKVLRWFTSWWTG